MVPVGSLLPLGDHGGPGRMGCRGVRIRPLRPSDLGSLMPTVGVLVDSLYPKGATKLLARLEEALNGYATAHVCDAAGVGPIALASETEKGTARIKLSTFWVDPRFRGVGLGGSLLEHRIESWRHRDLNRVVVTVRQERAPELERLFIPRGFSRVATDIGKYGEGQDEVVLKWTSDSLPSCSRPPVLDHRAA